MIPAIPAPEMPTFSSALASDWSGAGLPSYVYAAHGYDDTSDVIKLARIFVEGNKTYPAGVADSSTASTEIIKAIVFPWSMQNTDLSSHSVMNDNDQPWSSTTGNTPAAHRFQVWYRRIVSSAASISQVYIGNPHQGQQIISSAAQISREAPWIADLDVRIDSFAREEDSNVANATADRAKSVLRQFPADLAQPQVVPSVDGDVLFIWYNKGDHVEINIDPDGHTTWFGKFAGVYEPGDDVPDHAILPPSLGEMLHRLHG